MPIPRSQLAALVLSAVAGLAGCQVVSESPYAQVRVIEVSPDAPTVDLYQNSSAILYSIPPGTTTSYMAVPAGTYTYSVNIAGMRQQLISASAPLGAGAQYTVLVGDATATLHMTVLKDQGAPPPAGQAAVRLLHQGTRVGAIDLYLLPSSGKVAAATPLAANLSFGNTPVYLHVPGGTYSLLAVRSGAPPSDRSSVLYSGSESDFTSGSARTIVLYDQPSADTPGLQVLTANDIDPAA